MKDSSKGQTLVEVLLAVGVATLVRIGLTGAVTVSLRNAQFARNQALATKYAQEGIEKVRAYRDQNDWQSFTSNCESILDAASLPSPFQLSLDCYLPGSSNDCSPSEDNCEVKVIVSWTGARRTYQSELTTRLTKWK